MEGERNVRRPFETTGGNAIGGDCSGNCLLCGKCAGQSILEDFREKISCLFQTALL
jgi:hypothetical protein